MPLLSDDFAFPAGTFDFTEDRNACDIYQEFTLFAILAYGSPVSYLEVQSSFNEVSTTKLCERFPPLRLLAFRKPRPVLA